MRSRRIHPWLALRSLGLTVTNHIIKSPLTSEVIPRSIEEDEPAPTTATKSAPASTPQFIASEEGKGRATPSLDSSLASSPTPKRPSNILDVNLVWDLNPPASAIPVAALPLAPTPPSKVLDTGEGNAPTFNLFTPSKIVSSSTPKVPSGLTNLIFPPSSSYPSTSAHVIPPTPSPTIAPARLQSTALAALSLNLFADQGPVYPVDGDGDCIMADVSEESWREIQSFLDPEFDLGVNTLNDCSFWAHDFDPFAISASVAPVQTVFTPSEPQSMDVIPAVTMVESSQGSADSMEGFLDDEGVIPMEPMPEVPTPLKLEEPKRFSTCPKSVAGFQHFTVAQVTMGSPHSQELAMELAHETPADVSGGIWTSKLQEKQMGFETPSTLLHIGAPATPALDFIQPAADAPFHRYTNKPPMVSSVPKRPSPLSYSFSLADVSQSSVSYAAAAADATMESTADWEEPGMGRTHEAHVNESEGGKTATMEAMEFADKTPSALLSASSRVSGPVKIALVTSVDAMVVPAPRVIPQPSRPQPPTPAHARVARAIASPPTQW